MLNAACNQTCQMTRIPRVRPAFEFQTRMIHMRAVNPLEKMQFISEWEINYLKAIVYPQRS
jgi:hypothetical protein